MSRPRGRHVEVVEEGEEALSGGQPGFGRDQGVVEPEREERGHQRVALLAPFGLKNLVHLVRFISPEVPGRSRVE